MKAKINSKFQFLGVILLVFGKKLLQHQLFSRNCRKNTPPPNCTNYSSDESWGVTLSDEKNFGGKGGGTGSNFTLKFGYLKFLVFSCFLGLLGSKSHFFANFILKIAQFVRATSQSPQNSKNNHKILRLFMKNDENIEIVHFGP